MSVITRAAPAKLNLTLEIVGKRADGYHLLDSLVAFTAYGDTIAVSPLDGLTLTIDGPYAATLGGDDDDNLVIRAARALASAAGIAPQAAITLTKRLPVASGIGGGSSDAAATLLALTDLWGIPLTRADLHRIGLGLGADVPVCLAGHPARLEGIGEIVTPAPALPEAPIVMVNPGIGLSTPAVFKARNGPFSTPHEHGVLSALPRDAVALTKAIARYGNDLTDAAMRLLPVIGDILSVLSASTGCLTARMSGSGATCFALYTSDSNAQAAVSALKADHPDWWAVATRLHSAAA